MPLVSGGSNMRQLDEIPFGHKQENPADGNIRQLVISLKTRSVFMGWIRLTSSFHFTFLSRELESE
jgi:hypothetical protein